MLLAGLIAGGSALVLGAMHALEPGHGKSVIAAYMAGNKGGIWHIVVLGLSVAISHTGSILLLSLALNLLASNLDAADHYTEQLELLSSILIISVGLYMLYRYRKNFVSDHHVHDHTCNHDHGHDHDHHLGEHHHVNKKESYRFMAMLGLSSGIIPCPTALAAFFSAGAMGNYTSAFSNTIFYSIGIALTLMGIGLLTLFAGNRLDKYIENNSFKRYLPIISAFIVLAIGVYSLVSGISHDHVH